MSCSSTPTTGHSTETESQSRQQPSISTVRKASPQEEQQAQSALEAGLIAISPLSLEYHSTIGANEIIEQLLQAGVDPNIAVYPNIDVVDPQNIQKDREISSPLLSAIRHQQTDSVRLLLDFGADPNLSVAQQIPLLLACKEQEEKILAELLLSGANPYVTDEKGQNCWEILCMRSRKPLSRDQQENLKNLLMNLEIADSDAKFYLSKDRIHKQNTILRTWVETLRAPPAP